jgi:hypothetical protein
VVENKEPDDKSRAAICARVLSQQDLGSKPRRQRGAQCRKAACARAPRFDLKHDPGTVCAGGTGERDEQLGVDLKGLGSLEGGSIEREGSLRRDNDGPA